MFKIRQLHRDLCVIRIKKEILAHPNTVIADQNASSNYVRFSSGRDGLRLIDKNTIFARSWKHPDDQIAEWRHGSAMCAEVLIPDSVPPEYILGVYASCEESAEAIISLLPDLDVVVNGDLFFR